MKKYFIYSSLISVIFLTSVFIFGETFFRIIPNQITQYILPASTQLAAVSAPTSGLVAHYTFDDNVNDSAGTNNGTISGGATYVEGKIGKALSFDGTSSKVTTTSDFIGASPLTISIWVNPRSYSDGGPLLIDNGKTRLLMNSAEKTYRFRSDGATTASLSVGSLNTWTHLVITRDSSGVTNFYENGIQSGTANQSSGIPVTGGMVIIGNSVYGNSSFDGLIDDLRVYNRVLTSTEVADLYNYTELSVAPLLPAPEIITSPPISTSDIYIAQIAKGSDNGTDCANAHSIAWFNNGTNWGGGGNDIMPGNTVHLCGVFTAAANGRLLIVPASGVAGQVVTILFEKDTVLQAPYFEYYYGAIRIPDGISYIKVDGGVNGIIQNTDNGSLASGKTYHNGYTEGMYIAGTSNVEVTNLTIRNIFINTGGDQSSASDISGLNSVGLHVNHSNTNLSIHDSHFSNARAPLALGNDGAVLNGVEIYNNTIRDGGWSIGIGSGSPNSRITNLNIHHNDISDWTLWQYPGGPHSPTDTYHTDGLIIFQNTPDFNTAYYTGMFHDNYVHGNLGSGSPTAYLSMGCGGKDFSVFNNVFESDPNKSTVAIWISGNCSGYNGNNPINSRIYNNTFIGENNYSRWGLGSQAMVIGGTPTDVKNNIIYNYFVAFRADVPITADYNLYKTTYATLGPKTFTQWVAEGQEAHGINIDPGLNISYHPITGSSAIDAGMTLTSLGIAALNVDKNGVSRPQGSAWDIGAYEYTGGGEVVQPVNPPVIPPTTYKPGDFDHNGSINVLDFSAMKMYWNYSDTLSTPYDLNKDGIVNTLDYAIMVQGWTG